MKCEYQNYFIKNVELWRKNGIIIMGFLSTQQKQQGSNVSNKEIQFFLWIFIHNCAFWLLIIEGVLSLSITLFPNKRPLNASYFWHYLNVIIWLQSN